MEMGNLDQENEVLLLAKVVCAMEFEYLLLDAEDIAYSPSCVFPVLKINAFVVANFCVCCVCRVVKKCVFSEV